MVSDGMHVCHVLMDCKWQNAVSKVLRIYVCTCTARFKLDTRVQQTCMCLRNFFESLDSGLRSMQVITRLASLTTSIKTSLARRLLYTLVWLELIQYLDMLSSIIY